MECDEARRSGNASAQRITHDLTRGLGLVSEGQQELTWPRVIVSRTYLSENVTKT
jgi:hypothetical protein